MSKMKIAQDIGFRICDRISKRGLKFIEQQDPDLHYEIEQELKRKGKKR